MLACDLREKGEDDDDDLEISLVVIVVEESRINQVAFTREKKERKKGPSTGCKRAWRMQTAPSGLSLFILFRLGCMRYVCIHVGREKERKRRREKGESARICRKAK